MMDFDGKFSTFRSFGPFNKVMDTAPLTHIIVPTIFVIDLKLRMFTLSSFLCIFDVCLECLRC